MCKRSRGYDWILCTNKLENDGFDLTSQMTISYPVNFRDLCNRRPSDSGLSMFSELIQSFQMETGQDTMINMQHDLRYGHLSQVRSRWKIAGQASWYAVKSELDGALYLFSLVFADTAEVTKGNQDFIPRMATRGFKTRYTHIF